MSQSVHDVLSAITVASEALTREPQLQSQITTLESQLNSAQSHGQELELKIIDYKNSIDSLNEKVRSLEVERDDAQFRNLQLEETIHKALSDIRTSSHRLDEAIGRLDPPKPEPVMGQVVSNVEVSALYTGDYGSSQTTSTSHGETGQSVSSPSTHTDTPITTQSHDTVGSTTVPSPEGGAVKGPYADRKWSETWRGDGTRVWSRQEWFDGGGNEETYNQ